VAAQSAPAKAASWRLRRIKRRNRQSVGWRNGLRKWLAWRNESAAVVAASKMKWLLASAAGGEAWRKCNGGGAAAYRRQLGGKVKWRRQEMAKAAKAAGGSAPSMAA